VAHIKSIASSVRNCDRPRADGAGDERRQHIRRTRHVKPVPMTGLTVQGDQIALKLPSKSVVVVEIR
jgi:hypothetical protein